MSIVWIENLTVNERPRSTQMCAHCQKACIEAVPRARLSYLNPETRQPTSAHLHIMCTPAFVALLLKNQSTQYKESLKARGRKLL